MYGNVRRRDNSRATPLARWLRAMVIGIAGAWLAVIAWNGINGDLRILTIHASVRPALSGRTVLDFPPMGSISAATHVGPVRLDLRVDQVHVEETAEWLRQRKKRERLPTGLERRQSL